MRSVHLGWSPWSSLVRVADSPVQATPRLSSSPPMPRWPPLRSDPLLSHFDKESVSQLSFSKGLHSCMVKLVNGLSSSPCQCVHLKINSTVPGSGAMLSSSTSAPWNGSVTKSDLERNRKQNSSSIKLLTTRSVDYPQERGRDSWKETLLLNFSNLFFGCFEHHAVPLCWRESRHLYKTVWFTPKQDRWTNSK